MIAGFLLGDALLTKSPAIFFVLLLPFTLLLALSYKNKVEVLKVLPLLFVTYVIGFGLYNILRLGPEFHMLAIRNKDYVYPLTHVLESPFDPLITFLKASIVWLWKLGPGIFVLLSFAGLILNFKKYPKEVLLVTAWALLPLLVSAEYAKVFTARYILYVLPYLVVLSALVFRSKKIKFIKVLLVVLLFHAALIDFKILGSIESAPLPRSERSGYLEEWTAGTGIKKASEFIRTQHKNNPSQKIVVGTEGYFGTLPDGLQAYLNDLPEITVIGTGLDFTEIPSSLIDSKRAGNKTFFVVNDSRMKVKPEEIGLLVLQSYPKAQRPDGSREVLLLMEVGDLPSDF
jgi:hypothetical protein